MRGTRVQQVSWWLTLAMSASGAGLLLGPWLLTKLTDPIMAMPGPGWLRVTLAQSMFELGLLGPAFAAVAIGTRVGWLVNPWAAAALPVAPALAERTLAAFWGESFLAGWGWHGLMIGAAAIVILGRWPRAHKTA